MKKLAVLVFLVLGALSWCFPAGSEPGCALNVTTVFCGDETVNSSMEECTGPPPPNTVCQRGGRAFVSTNTSGPCEFENTGHIPTERCSDNTDVCDFTRGTTPSPLTIPESRSENQKGPRTHYTLVVPGVILVLLVGLVLYWSNTKKSNQQRQSVAVVDC